MRKFNRKMGIEGYKAMVKHEKKMGGDYDYQMDEDWSFDELKFSEKFEVINTCISK